MNMPQRPIPVAASDDDETEGHGRSWADAERAEGDSDETGPKATQESFGFSLGRAPWATAPLATPLPSRYLAVLPGLAGAPGVCRDVIRVAFSRRSLPGLVLARLTVNSSTL